jgi:hypothetical protein
MKRLDGEEPLHPSLLLLYLCLLLINQHVQILCHLPTMRFDVLLHSMSKSVRIVGDNSNPSMVPDVLVMYFRACFRLCSLYPIRSPHPFRPYLNSLHSRILQIVLVNAYGQPSYRQAGKNPYEGNEYPSGEACREESAQGDIREASGNRERERQTDRQTEKLLPHKLHATRIHTFKHAHSRFLSYTCVVDHQRGATGPEHCNDVALAKPLMHPLYLWNQSRDDTHEPTYSDEI